MAFKYILRFSLIIGILLLSIPGFSQGDWNVIIDGKVVSGSKKLENAIITLYKNGSIDKKVRTPVNGKFTLTLYPENDYLIEVAKEGFVTKKISFNTEGVPEENVGSGFPSYPITVDIFEKIKGLDTKILDQPIGRIRYYAKGDNFDFDEAYTRQIQDQLRQLRADIEAKMEEYKAAMDNGGRYTRSKDYDKAKQSYEIALDILPNETQPKAKLAEVEKLIEQARAKEAEEKKRKAAAEEAARLKELEEKYQRAVAAGESALKMEKYQGAKEKFEEALQLKPEETLPKQKLKEIDAKLKELELQEAEAKRLAEEEARLRALEESYKKAIAAADAAMTSKKYDEARNSYENALEIKSNEAYPKEQLLLIEKKIEEDKLRAAEAKQKAEEEARLKKIEEDYMKAIGAGANALKDKDYTEARAQYNLALTIKPNETYPKEKLAEMDQLIKTEELAREEAAKKEEEAARIKAEEEARRQAEAAEKERLAAELEAKYEKAISEADNAFNGKDYFDSKKKYEYALTLKSRESYPQDQLDKIEDILFELEKEEAANRKLENEYNAAIMVGDQAFDQKNYSVAQTQYQTALELKPDATYPKEQLTRIEQEIEKQKMEEEEAKRLAAEQEKEQEKEKRYQDALTKADNAFNNGYFQNAKKFYVEALGIKPNESYPTNRIGVIEKKLDELQRVAELEKQKASEAEAQKALDNQYVGLIKDGDIAFNLNEYEKAKLNYRNALELKPGEAYPSGKIEEIEKLILAMKRQKQEEAEKRTRYQALIDQGDQEFQAKNYEKSLSLFSDALKVQPKESYPKTKISEIEGLIEEERKRREAEEIQRLEEDKRKQELAEKTEGYQQLIANGDEAMASKKYSEAVRIFEQARMVFPDKTYPQDKLDELSEILAAEAAKKAAKEEAAKKREQEYQESIARGNGAFELGRFSEAKGYYEKALSIQPDAQYPKDKLAEIMKKIAAMRDRAAELERLQEEAAKQEAPEPTQEKERFLTELALEYPEGLTEETYNEGNKKVVRRIVVQDGRSDDYRMVIQPWGAKFYFKNDHSIPKHQFDTETNNVN